MHFVLPQDFSKNEANHWRVEHALKSPSGALWSQEFPVHLGLERGPGRCRLTSLLSLGKSGYSEASDPKPGVCV